MYLSSSKLKFKHVYDIDELKKYYEYAQRDIERAEAVIKEIKEYQMELFEHSQTVLNTPTRKIVGLQRSVDYSTNHVHFYVALYHKPIVEEEFIHGSGTVYGKKSHEKTFKGKERSDAIKYAQDLAKENHCELIMKGFKKHAN